MKPTYDIFLSYASEDLEYAKSLAHTLEEQGWSIWWDRKTPFGKHFDEEITENLAAAKTVIVLWTNNSVRSHWVRAEASEAASRGILIPILIGSKVKIPLEFKFLQAANLFDWKPKTAHPEFERLVVRIRELLHEHQLNENNLNNSNTTPLTSTNVETKKWKQKKISAVSGLVISFCLIAGSIIYVLFIGFMNTEVMDTDNIDHVKQSKSLTKALDDRSSKSTENQQEAASVNIGNIRNPPLELLLTIGGAEGNGPGFFKDTRWVGVDGSGRIYTADYDNEGRIQVFDAMGKYLTQWAANEKMITRMAVSREGIVYLLLNSRVFRYDGMTGKLLGTLPSGDDSDTVYFSRIEAMTITVNNELILAGPDLLIRYNEDGEILQKLFNMFDGLTTDKIIHIEDIATDGSNNLYILTNRFDEAIYKFSKQGIFIDRIGQYGDKEGDFIAPASIAIDGQGRLYVNDFSGIMIFEQNGRYQEIFKLFGVAFSIKFDTENNLYRMDRNANQVQKFRVLH